MNAKILNPSRQTSGYLLLEVTLAIAITGMILGAVFKIAEWNLKVSSEAMKSSNEQIKQAAFFSFLDRAFQELSGDARVELRSTETATHYLSEMIIQNSGEVFSWPNQPFTPKAIKIVTKPNRDKTLDILLEYYADPLIADDDQQFEGENNANQKPLQTLILLDDIWRFEWRIWDGRSNNRNKMPLWEYEWERPTPPRYFELNAVFSPDEKEAVHVFWNPQKVNPARHFRQFVRESNRRDQARERERDPFGSDPPFGGDAPDNSLRR